jgi:hypothetical protein
MQAWVPAIALWLWHTLASGRRPRGAPVDLTTVWTRLTADFVLPASDQPALSNEPVLEPATEHAHEPNQQTRVPARVEVRRLLRRHGTRLTPDQVVRRTGVSIPHARRLIRQERGPRLVDQPVETEGRQ